MKVCGFLFNNTEPVRMIRGVGVFIHVSVHLHTYNLANFVIDAGWYLDVAFDPRHVRDDGDFEGREEVFMEMIPLGVIPGESFVLEDHEVV